MARQNMALFQRAASLLNPTTTAGESEPAAASEPDPEAGTASQIKELNARIEALQKQLGELIEAQQNR
jgi:polyhydroxyalkanoate synthesis regulator protein